MKKIIIVSFILLTTIFGASIYADNNGVDYATIAKGDRLEDSFQINKRILKAGSHHLTVDDYDLDIYPNRAILEIELYNDKNSTPNKVTVAQYKALAEQFVTDIKKEFGTNTAVDVIIITEDHYDNDQILYSGQF